MNLTRTTQQTEGDSKDEPGKVPPIEPAEDPEELLDFASSLDFEQFVDDLEFREALSVLRDRAKKLEREEKLFQMNVYALQICPGRERVGLVMQMFHHAKTCIALAAKN